MQTISDNEEKIPFWKQPNVWWAPILLAILTGVGWLIKQHIEDSHKLAIILGRVEPPPPNIAIYLDSKKITETSVSGWYRAENISPGEHEIEWSIGDKQFKTIPVKIEGGKENKIDLPKSTSLTINANGIADVKNDTEIHRWFAGANYIGNVDMSPEYPFIWHCSGGTCNLEGPYGTGLNMRVCQLLSKKVGGLEYYYNDAGMRWTKAENASLLKQCNDLNT